MLNIALYLPVSQVDSPKVSDLCHLDFRALFSGKTRLRDCLSPYSDKLSLLISILVSSSGTGPTIYFFE